MNKKSHRSMCKFICVQDWDSRLWGSDFSEMGEMSSETQEIPGSLT